MSSHNSRLVNSLGIDRHLTFDELDHDSRWKNIKSVRSPRPEVSMTTMWLLILMRLLALCLANPNDLTVMMANASTNAEIGSSSTSSLIPRQCICSAAANKFDCDEWLPTLNEFIKRMQDTNDGGKATPQNHAFFYANLVDATLDPKTPAFDTALTQMYVYIHAWAQSHGLGENWYAAAWHHPLRLDWALAQRKHVRDNQAAFDRKYGGSGAAQDYFDICYSQAMAYAALVGHPSPGGRILSDIG